MLVGKEASNLHVRSENFDRIMTIMRHLIGAGADLHAVDHYGNSVFHDAVGYELSFASTFSDTLATLKAVQQLKVVTSSTNHERRTALHIAAAKEVGRGARIDCKMLAELDFLLQPDVGIKISGSTARIHGPSIIVIQAVRLLFTKLLGLEIRKPSNFSFPLARIPKSLL